MKKFSSLLISIKNYFKFLIIKKKLHNKKYTHVYFGSPSHGNLGDRQIRNSSIEFLKQNNINFIEIPRDLFCFIDQLNLSNITTICLHGGGNFGDEYPMEHLPKEYIIRKYADKKIIIFPQTIHYKNQNELEITKLIFKSHPNLVLVAREQKSFEIMKQNFNSNKILLTPDMVLSSDFTSKFCSKRKKQVLFLTRRDVEKSIPQNKLEKLKQNLITDYTVLQADTDISSDKATIKAKKEIKKLMLKISSSSLVVTDRLHGMIFSAITATPCIVLSNYNHKIKSTYDTWLKDLDFIRFYDNIDEIDINKLAANFSKKSYTWTPLTEKFDTLEKELENTNGTKLNKM